MHVVQKSEADTFSDLHRRPNASLWDLLSGKSLEKLQSFAFLVFVVVCALGSLYLYFILPETKNKTFMDISRSFAKINKIPVPSPSQEMELVLSFKSDESGKVQDAANMESSY
ncbi:Solute carrier family 2, facilitated glucose transporter member 9 [Collichthys lucidus]|uniref:Solute carrier family 2, facilitated glucose transporter member 9 n=1 Tax=Collichthys lucidus TaxID=240159 RepID=A0A4V6AN19_COLLU|nr:Solute carrier family 2, facilitated glucose transporter member 9 [Collichthys lucidus]